MKKSTNILFLASSVLAATATFIVGRITGYNKGKNEPVKVSGQLKVVYEGKDDTHPQLGFILHDIKDLKRDYIVMQVDRTIVDKKASKNDENIDA